MKAVQQRGATLHTDLLFNVVTKQTRNTLTQCSSAYIYHTPSSTQVSEGYFASFPLFLFGCSDPNINCLCYLNITSLPELVNILKGRF